MKIALFLLWLEKNYWKNKMDNISELSIIIDGEHVATITVEVSDEYLLELGTADELNSKLRGVVSKLLEELRYKKAIQ